VRDAVGGAASDPDVGAEDVPVSGAGAGIGLGAGGGAGSGPGPGPGTTIDCPPLREAGSGTGSVGRIEP
jgi:hypothetical protein